MENISFKVGVSRGDEAFTRRLVHSVTHVNNFSSSYICNLGRSDLPDMYARGRAAPKCECRHIRKITTAHVTYVM